ncbi:MAG: PspC domain-containing protein [Eubacteriales bacterium]|nr:PspC domain-containing protein [Eubacteriales bacterium]
MDKKRLYKSDTNRMICGVCGGIGEFLNIDPTIVRLILVLLGFTSTGIIFYILAAIIMPSRPY